MFVGRSCIVNKRPLKLLQGGLHRQQKDFERLHSGFASCTNGLWSYFKGFCTGNKRALNVCRKVLHHVQKGLEVTSRGLATCTKRAWSYFRGSCIVYKRAMKLLQGALYRVQKGYEQCKNGFCSWNNLGLKLLQVVFASCTIWAWSYFRSILHRVQFGPWMNLLAICLRF